jgi:hypothetical protein
MRAFCQVLVNAGFLAIGLAACSSGGEWEKPGASTDDRDLALAECRQEARVATNRDAAINQDIASTRMQDWTRSGVSDTRRELLNDQTRALGEDIFNRCMAAKGWVRVVG